MKNLCHMTCYAPCMSLSADNNSSTELNLMWGQRTFSNQMSLCLQYERTMCLTKRSVHNTIVACACIASNLLKIFMIVISKMSEHFANVRTFVSSAQKLNQCLVIAFCLSIGKY